MAISELAILAGVYYVLYAAEVTAPDYYFGLLRLEHLGGGMLFRLPTSFVKVLSYSRLYNVAERLRKDPALVALAFYRDTRIDWSSSVDSDDFVSYYFSMVTV